MKRAKQAVVTVRSITVFIRLSSPRFGIRQSFTRPAGRDHRNSRHTPMRNKMLDSLWALRACPSTNLLLARFPPRAHRVSYCRKRARVAPAGNPLALEIDLFHNRYQRLAGLQATWHDACGQACRPGAGSSAKVKSKRGIAVTCAEPGTRPGSRSLNSWA